ncbi:MAG TPA: O-antigen ligase family protein [Thermoanaerobaculia bacterium]|nr:O-antigen ligase family protein [Thermoanaerobaculia bacterium]
MKNEQDLFASRRGWAWSIVASMLLIVPVAFDGVMKDAFRGPKEIAFRGGAILLFVIFCFLWTPALRLNWPAFRKPVILIPTSILLWASVTTLTSQNPRLSVDSLFTVVSSVIFFFGARFALKTRRTPIALDYVMVGPIINAILEMMQEFGFWQPFHFPTYLTGHAASTALLGNPNDVGVFLVLPAVVSVIAVATLPERRMVYLAIAAVIIGGLVVSGTRTALIAFVAAMIAAIVIQSRRVALILLAALFLAVIPVALPTTKPGQDVRALMKAAKLRQYDILFSERLPGFLAAVNMFRDHPFVGVGPGSYKFLYMPYRTALSAEYPPEWTKGQAANFREVHNDHLQIIAETGFPGYSLAIAAILVLALPARKGLSTSGDHMARFARSLRLPLVTAAAVTALAQFPFQLAAPRMAFLYFAAICVTFDE